MLIAAHDAQHARCSANANSSCGSLCNLGRGWGNGSPSSWRSRLESKGSRWFRSLEGGRPRGLGPVWHRAFESQPPPPQFNHSTQREEATDNSGIISKDLKKGALTPFLSLKEDTKFPLYEKPQTRLHHPLSSNSPLGAGGWLPPQEFLTRDSVRITKVIILNLIKTQNSGGKCRSS